MICRVESQHFWFQPREKLLTRTLLRQHRPPAVVRDVGCGSGSWVRHLRGLGYRVMGTDIWPEAPAGLAAEEYASGTAEALPWPEASCDVVTMLDALEHVDDVPALGECHRVLRPDGILLLSVPAFPGLWSQRDVRAGHRRRYTRRSLAAALRQARLRPIQMFGFQFFLLPMVWMSRRIARRRASQLAAEEMPARPINRLLGWLNEVEVWAGQLMRPPWGSSLVAVARKMPR